MVSVQRVFIVVHVTGIDNHNIKGDDDDDDLAGAQDAAMLTSNVILTTIDVYRLQILFSELNRTNHSEGILTRFHSR